MPKRKNSSYYIFNEIALIEKEINEIKQIKNGEIDVDLLVVWKEKLKEDLLKIRQRLKWKRLRPTDDLSDEFYQINFDGNTWSTATSFQKRCAAFKKIPSLNWYGAKQINEYCPKSGIRMKCMNPFYEDHSIACSECYIMTPQDKQKPFSLLHLSASQVISQLEKYDVKSLDIIYSRLYPLKLAVRAGYEKRGCSRRVYYLHNIIKHFIHKELNQSIIDEQYFKCIKIRPVAFCFECANILENKLYVEERLNIHPYLKFCECKLCKFLRLGIYYTSLFEINGHFIQCTEC